jgi:cytochrome oxidase Cu insertion factor (SCO1/SenC/PrrC family)
LASLATTLMIVSLAVLSRSARARAEFAPDGRPALFAIPDFTLTDQAGAPFTLADLKSKFSVVSFIFTQCRGACPLMIGQASALRDELDAWPPQARDQVQLVCISVDPETDTPEVLAQYAQRLNADPQRWRFLTGPKDYVWKLIQEGFKMHVGPSDDPLMPISHTQVFMLIDPQGNVRGIYRALDDKLADGTSAPNERAALVADLKRLMP